MSDLTRCFNVQIDNDFLHIHEDKVQSLRVLRRWLPHILALHLPTPPKHRKILPPCFAAKTPPWFVFQVWDKTVYDSSVLPLESKCIHF